MLVEEQLPAAGIALLSHEAGIGVALPARRPALTLGRIGVSIAQSCLLRGARGADRRGAAVQHELDMRDVGTVGTELRAHVGISVDAGRMELLFGLQRKERAGCEEQRSEGEERELHPTRATVFVWPTARAGGGAPRGLGAGLQRMR